MKGVQARQGPPPDPNALRRDRDPDAWQRFPSKRDAETPKWPLPKPTAREKLLWAELWKRGEANAWAMFGLEHAVALFVRVKAIAEVTSGNASLVRTLLAQEDRLGLTPAGARYNRWIIAADELTDAPESDQPAPTQRQATSRSARDRLRLLDNGT